MAEKKVRDIMTTEVVTLMLGDTLRLAHDMMNLTGLRHFPITEQRRVVGVIDRLGLVRASLSLVIKHGKRSPCETLGMVAVKDVMTDPPTIIPPQMTIKEAARMMVEKQIDCLLVVEGESLVGIATRTDLLKEFAKG
jgi:CBS domain-containing protein